MSVPSPIREASWQVHWKVSESAGLTVYLVDFRNRRVLWEGSLPYVTVDHQRQDVGPEDEHPDIHGPFWFPLGTRSLRGDVRMNKFRGGFELAADFAAGPFRYTQLWRFHEDGRVSPWLTIHGRGLHAWHSYHPHWRFDFDVHGAMDDAFETWSNGRWTRVSEEGWLPYTGEVSPEGDAWRQVDFGSGAAVHVRPHHWEDAEIFAIRYRPGDWPPFSPRTSFGEQPFPAGYAGNEPLDGQDISIWYVGHVHYDRSFPFTAGPWIRVVEA
ncbi:MAG: hypothetical protein HY698_09080 [Deltaproteobacteria bacterium]|nr:hypothetical protein [Deltaproteobacteria bacterium]